MENRQLDELLKKLATQIKQARQAQGWDQEKLAAWCGVSKAQIYKVEQSVSKSSISLFFRICDALSLGVYPLRTDTNTDGDFHRSLGALAGRIGRLEDIQKETKEKIRALRPRLQALKTALASLGVLDSTHEHIQAMSEGIESALSPTNLMTATYLHIAPDALDETLRELMTETAPGEKIFATAFVDPNASSYWRRNPNRDQYFQANIEALERGIEITRVFIIRGEVSELPADDREAIAQHARAGISVSTVNFYVLEAQDLLYDMVLYGDHTALVIFKTPFANVAPDARILRDFIFVESLKKTRDKIREKAKPFSL